MKFARIGLRVREPGVARNIKTGITDMPLERRVCPRAAERRQAITLFSSRQTTVRRRKVTTNTCPTEGGP
jgi:hypothetical protein